jgi:hypothetical protein
MMNRPDPDTRSTKRAIRFQFSLRTLLILTAGFSLLMGMMMWRGEWGVMQFFLGTALCLIAAGVLLRRLGLIVCGVIALVAMTYAVSFSARRTGVSTTSGWRTMTLVVEVVDAETDKPIAGAVARVLPSRGSPSQPTASDGQTEVTSDFSYITMQSDSLFGSWDRCWISLSGYSVQAEAEGYVPAKVRLADRLGEEWNVPGPPPPVVTVPLRRASPNPSGDL